MRWRLVGRAREEDMVDTGMKHRLLYDPVIMKILPALKPI